MSYETTDFLFELYHNASQRRPEDFRLHTLKKLQSLIPFDFAVWGGGWADGRLVSDLTVLDQSEAVLKDWEAVADQDAFCDLTLRHLGTTARFDDVPEFRRSFAYNEHWRQVNASHMMATIKAEHTDGYVSFVGLCADDRPSEFSETERSFKQALMPHLSQALRINRELWTHRTFQKEEAVALVDQEGWILLEHGAFREFTSAEWGDFSARIPPEVMGTLVKTHYWRGQSLTARLSDFDSHYFIHILFQPELACLTPRERQVAELFATGMTHKQVAATLDTSPSTVRNQLVRIYDKLGISSKASLAALLRQA
ncbi:transcriptional regulator, LuxR family [Hyphomonas neptunium ATCC 15444]|uniref:Transcriptional regulator, LuxR family n=2 Tax=Hyphomonas TaxID=85 RepID=Q0BZC7_HYPNA|nr:MULTISPECIES: helix-turn-helix transcriptional regulator [Hyphomonas]ABI75799.1 transcriptional regulator, LuxR family [Hyphomonas neptunium ATCC 15444]KCZ95255.1 LuxR family transcriptional regulator [Hyphomonas hirschiana VP5]